MSDWIKKGKKKRKRKPRHRNKNSNPQYDHHINDVIHHVNEDTQNANKVEVEVEAQNENEVISEGTQNANEDKQVDAEYYDEDAKVELIVIDEFDKNDEFAVNDDFHQTEIMLLQSDNFELKNEIAALKQQLAQESKHDRCYTRNEVLEYHSTEKNDIETRSEIKEKQTKIEQAFNIHVNRLKKWNDFPDKLQSTFKNNEIEDDEKKNENEEVIQLLDLYTNCMQLLYKQQLRTEDIAEYAASLSKSKKELRNIVGEYTMNQQPTQQKYKELCTKYTTLKLQREELQQQVTKLMDEINQITDEENKVNKEKCEMLDNLNVSVVEKENFDVLLRKCKSLTSKYSEFQNNVEDKSNELEKYFVDKWDGHEKVWPQWDVNDIICWIKYLIHDKKIQLSKDVDLQKIEREMNMQKITGKSLEEMEKNDLKLFGFVVFDDMKQLYKRIRELVSKYPDISDKLHVADGGEGQILMTAQVQIPKEYTCPISGKIMFDPVLYEEITYDRNNFIEHVEKYGILPGSDQKYDKTEPLFKNIKLKQKIDAFLNVYPQFINEGL